VTLILIGVRNNIRPGVPSDSGLADCTAVSGTRQVAAANYPRIRAEFADSRWPDLRAAGTSYIDLVIKLRRPQYTDGYETVSYCQRPSVAYAKHGRVLDASISLVADLQDPDGSLPHVLEFGVAAVRAG